MERFIGKMLDNRYEILEVIGQGGMAVVYKAKCHRLNRLVAIKVLKPELADDADFRRRFHDESQAVAMLSHPNIVSVYDVSRGGDLEYIVMELIDGITLKQYMERRGQLNWREALHFITQVMRGLSHAHSRGIIHRDIKPQNIMILRDGSVKVADFGIACLTAKTTQTMAGKDALGSVHYISPEQAKGDRIDQRSDIYSAGVVLYEMLTSRLPFEGDSPVSIAIRHFSAVPLNPREMNPDIPEALELICLKAMAPQPDRRYASADEMIRDLEEFRKNPEINFDYDMADLRGEAVIDEPTMPLKSRDIRTISRTRDEEDDEDDDRGRSRPWKIALTALIVILFSVFVIKGLYNVILNSFGDTGITQYVVPDIRGMTVEEAEADEQVAGKFEINVIAETYDSTYAAGAIMTQDPEPNTTKRSDFVINVTISKGVQSGEMPRVSDYSRTAAELVLKGLDLDLDIQYKEEYHDTIPAGNVISSDPQPGATLTVGDTVTLTVSLGKKLKNVTVPSFINMSRADAENNLKALNLVGTFVEQDSSAPAGTVVGQSIEAYTSVLEETPITLYISNGNALYDPEGVPDGSDPQDPVPDEPAEPGVEGGQ